MEDFFLKKVALKSEVRKMVGSAVFQADFIRAWWVGDKFCSNSRPYMLEYGSGRVYGQLRAGVPGVIQVRVGGRRVPLFLDGYNAEKRELVNSSFITDDLLLYRSAPMVVNLREHGEAEGRLVLEVESLAEGYRFLPMDFEPLEPEVATVEMLAGKADRTELSNVVSEDVDEDVEAVEPNLLTDALRKTEQALTDEEKAQVLENTGVTINGVSAELIAECAHAGIVYNAATGFFELNGLTDLSESDVRNILPYRGIVEANVGYPVDRAYALGETRCRTFPEIRLSRKGGRTSGVSLFSDSGNLEVVVFRSSHPSWAIKPYYYGFYTVNNMFARCPKLHTVKGLVLDVATKLIGTFNGCWALKNLEIINLNSDVDLRQSPNLTMESLAFIVEWRYEEGKFDQTGVMNAITITLHPDAYARLTDELVAAAAEKQITFATI